MFGNFERTLDDKNRVMIPSKLREALGQVCFITLGPDRVLEVRDEATFKVFNEKLQSPNMLNKNARIFARLLLGNTVEVELDKTGRIAIPEHFLKLAAITKEVTFVGVGQKIEIWSTEAFNNLQKQYESENSIDDLAALLLKDGVEL